MVAMMAIAISAAAMPYTEASDKALFLSDKMAYELNLTKAQYDAVYEINLDYLLNIDEESDVFGYLWNIRNRDMKQVLSNWQYNNYQTSNGFYRPFTMNDEGWTLAIYDKYEQGQLLMDQPDTYTTFTGGHNQMEGSFYADQNFDKPTSPTYLGQKE
jgi:hypothetical protein